LRFAEVIIDINSSSVDKIYDYIVPEDMELQPGMRVVVDFNRRLIEGFVVGIKETSEIHISKLKSVVKLIDSKPVLTGKQLVLAHWMKERYLCHLVEALKCIMPVGSSKSMETARMMITLRVSEDEVVRFISSNSRNTRQVAVLSELLKNKLHPLAASQVIKATGADYSVLKRLKEMGLVYIFYGDVDKNPYTSYRCSLSGKLKLTAEQRMALDEIKKGLDAGSGKYLLHGVTGSGKTEVFLQAIEYNIEKGKDAIVLVPEISLTPQTIERFKKLGLMTP